MSSNCSPSAIRRALADILASKQFSTSPQMSAFLRYVVEESIAGNQERIKAYTIAVDALGKLEDFDGQKDPSVRVLAVRLRSCLTSYYLENETDVVISMPRGGYKPQFEPALQKAASADEEDSSHVATKESALASEFTEALLPTSTTDSSTVAPTPEEADTEISASSVPTDGVGWELNTRKAASVKSTSQARDAAVGNEYSFYERRRKISEPVVRGSVLMRVLSAGVIFLISYVGYHTIIEEHAENTSETAAATFSQPAVESKAMNVAVSTPLSTISKKDLRARPSLPTVHINNIGLDAPLRQVVTSQVTSGMANSGRVRIIRESHVSKLTNFWPEDYELLIENSTANDQGKVTFLLRHFSAGEVVYVAKVSLDLDGGARSSADSLEGIQSFAARLVQLGGPVINDYVQRDSARPVLVCLFRQQMLHSLAKDFSIEMKAGQAEARERQLEAEECLAGLASTVTPRNDSLTSLILRAGIFVDAARSAETDEARTAPLENARKLAEQVISMSPFRADVHTLAMEVLRMSGDLEGADGHGFLAYELNRFDSEFLREYAELLDELDRPADSKLLRELAERLDR